RRRRRGDRDPWRGAVGMEEAPRHGAGISAARRPVMSRAEDVAIYEARGARWWTSNEYLLRGLRALVPPRMRWFGEVAGPWTGRRVLDLGCGGGFMSEAMARAGAGVIGVDPAPAAIAAARAHAVAQRLPVRYEVG